MGVAFEHGQGLVAGDAGHFHAVEYTELEQPGRGFMAQIVKSRIIDARAIAHSYPGLVKTVRPSPPPEHPAGAADLAEQPD